MVSRRRGGGRQATTAARKRPEQRQIFELARYLAWTKKVDFSLFSAANAGRSGTGATQPFDAAATNDEVCLIPDLCAARRRSFGWVESGCDAVAVGWACLFPPLSSGGASVAQP